ncbi:hypothetical protein [uncultured Draconibacterium sp.]|uniref:hypothetical protein n=1 Tax=uncultured Draconibacterium sp. TaxID=1573823 RepID=UPI003217CE36
MKYKVHHFELKMSEDQLKLEQFLNRLRGEVVSIVPNVKPIFRPMGATAKVDFLLIIEKQLNWE